MKWLLAIGAYFLFLWGWRKFSRWASPSNKKGEWIKTGKNKQKDNYINPKDIEDASYTEINESEEE